MWFAFNYPEHSASVWWNQLFPVLATCQYTSGAMYRRRQIDSNFTPSCLTQPPHTELGRFSVLALNPGFDFWLEEENFPTLLNEFLSTFLVDVTSYT
ncbi:hypothetical protein J6590_007731 [Homalodisca vitripennis]|nr:hypothetical protein J6590_011900 [Homalodisca vitripennis]KAG8288979.1 hypothetical protein J6590_007731 [Homalodisca vitripennis]